VEEKLTCGLVLQVRSCYVISRYVIDYHTLVSADLFTHRIDFLVIYVCSHVNPECCGGSSLISVLMCLLSQHCSMTERVDESGTGRGTRVLSSGIAWAQTRKKLRILPWRTPTMSKSF